MEKSDSATLNIARDIPVDPIYQIAASLSTKDVLNLATTCRKLSLILNSDNAWESKVLEWISQQDPRSGIVGTSVEEMKELLGLQTLRATYQALTTIKYWYSGLWYATSGHGPKGALLWYSLSRNNAGGGGGAKFQYYKYHNYSVSDTSLRFPWPTEVMEWHFQEPIADIEVRGIQGLVCSEEAEVIVESEIEVFGAPRLVPRLVERSIAQFRVQWAPDREYCTYKRAEILPSLQPLPPPSSPLTPTPGIYHGIYGSHGLEVLQLESTEGTRYQAWKLTGDPYVPATQISFRFDATSDNIRVGPYNAQRDDPFPTEDGPRPTYVVIFTMYMVIIMEQRPVALVIQNAQAQINRNPRIWQPEWVPATIVVYDYNLLDNSCSSTTHGLNESNRCVFSVIFEDEGEDQRHVIDFYRGKFPRANDF